MLKPLELELREPYFREVDYDPYLQISNTIRVRMEEAFSLASSKSPEPSGAGFMPDLTPVQEATKDEVVIEETPQEPTANLEN
jgi:hypothetical protein